MHPSGSRSSESTTALLVRTRNRPSRSGRLTRFDLASKRCYRLYSSSGPLQSRHRLNLICPQRLSRLRRLRTRPPQRQPHRAPPPSKFPFRLRQPQSPLLNPQRPLHSFRFPMTRFAQHQGSGALPTRQAHPVRRPRRWSARRGSLRQRMPPISTSRWCDLERSTVLNPRTTRVSHSDYNVLALFKLARADFAISRALQARRGCPTCRAEEKRHKLGSHCHGPGTDKVWL